VLVLTRAEVESLLDPDLLIERLALAMADLSSGRASVPDRIAALVEQRDAFLAAMPAYVPSLGALTCKLVSLFPHNAGGELPTHQAVVLAFDPDTGRPTAVLDGSSITALRTAAGSALSARLLARVDASVVAVLGTGVQARAHALAMPRVRPVRELRVAGRSLERAEELASQLASSLDMEVRACGSYAEAMAGADIVCATTHADEPVVRRAWLDPGTHVTSVGFNPDGREIDDQTVADALVVVESRGAALAPFPSGSNDLLQPIRDGVITPDHVHAEVGELVLGTRRGRESPHQITLYKSVGVAVQDAVAAALVLEAARSRGAGREVEL
jgi:ornithine cyclodeaminase/alanine dehydrogenase-like protein (mu-crystallin family)